MARPLLILSLLLAIPAVGAKAQAPAADWSKAETIDVVMTDFAFSPQTLQLRRGSPYLLRFVNKGSGGHSFASKDFFAAVSVRPEDQANVDRGKVDVSKGETKEVRLIPVTAGTFKTHCSHFLHKSFGMKGTAVIS